MTKTHDLDAPVLSQHAPTGEVMTSVERTQMESLEDCLGDGMTAYRHVVSMYHPFKLWDYVCSAQSYREHDHRLRVFAEALAVAFEFDAELPYRLRASHPNDATTMGLFEALNDTGELQPELVDAMVRIDPVPIG